jgi:hypothetical protein
VNWEIVLAEYGFEAICFTFWNETSHFPDIGGSWSQSITTLTGMCVERTVNLSPVHASHSKRQHATEIS